MVVLTTEGVFPPQRRLATKQADYHNKMGTAYLNEGKTQLAFVRVPEGSAD